MTLAGRLASQKQQEHSTRLFVTKHVTPGSTEMPSMTITNKHSCQCAFKAFKNTFRNNRNQFYDKLQFRADGKAILRRLSFQLELMSWSSVSWSRGSLWVIGTAMVVDVTWNFSLQTYFWAEKIRSHWRMNPNRGIFHQTHSPQYPLSWLVKA